MKAVILQPSYIPGRGYFDLIDRADVFIFYDDVQYDQHGWHNRNRIKTPRGTEWLTIPIQKQEILSNSVPINAAPICWDKPWNRSHWDKLRQSYETAPFFDHYASFVEKFYWDRSSLLADLTINSTIAIAREIGIEHTKFLRSSALEAPGTKTDRLIALLTQVGADEYLSGTSARDTIEAEKFHTAGIRLEYIEYNYPAYKQLYPPYDPQVSILDLLFMIGPGTLTHIRHNRA